MCDSNSNFGLSRAVLDSIIETAYTHGVSKLILYGSRARGDYKERSDIDLAVYGGDADGFALDIGENVPTLLRFDVVDMCKPVQAELVNSIANEGVVIYEKV